MTPTDIIQQRLLNQQLVEPKCKKPVEIISWLGAMQAQEYAMAKWAIGLRLPGWSDKDIEKDFNDGKFLRTHLMRPTWHFVAPDDIRWLLKLTAARVKMAMASYNRKAGLTASILKRSNDIIARALEGGRHLMRDELRDILEKKKIRTDEIRMVHLLMTAELDGIICSGPRQGNQFTYALLEERVPVVKSLTHHEALAELTLRYFTSRGPATLQDFVWWSGLTVKDAKEGVSHLPKEFIREEIEGKTYLFIPTRVKYKKQASSAFLMPSYDEYGISYKDRSAIFNNRTYEMTDRSSNPSFNPLIIIDGVIEGTWKRTIKGKSLTVETFPFVSLNKTNQQKLNMAVKKIRKFLGDEK